MTEYVVALCCMAGAELVPVESLNITAVDDGEAAAYGTPKADEVRGNLALTVNGSKTELRETAHDLSFPAGQGGLSLLRLTATYQAAVPDGWRSSPPKVEFAVLFQSTWNLNSSSLSCPAVVESRNW